MKTSPPSALYQALSGGIQARQQGMQAPVIYLHLHPLHIRRINYKNITIRIETMPMGMLIKNIQCHDQLSCNPAPKQRADNRAKHYSHAKYCHCHAVLPLRKCFKEYRLGNGLKSAAADALKDSEKYEALETPCEPQSSELRVNNDIEKIRYLFLPKNLLSHPVIGIIIALETR